MTPHELRRALSRHPIWAKANEQTVRMLLSRSQVQPFSPKACILEAGQEAQTIHLLLEGAVRVFYPADEARASEVTVKLFWAPAAFGDAESIMRTRWAETVEALTPGLVLLTPAPVYFKLMQRDSSVCFRQYWDVSRRFGVAIRTEKAANFDELRERVVALLAAYALHFGEERDDGTLIGHALPQDDLARQTNSNRRSIVRVLTELYDLQLVAREGRRFLIPSLPRLLETTKKGEPSLSFSSDPEPWAVK